MRAGWRRGSCWRSWRSGRGGCGTTRGGRRGSTCWCCCPASRCTGCSSWRVTWRSRRCSTRSCGGGAPRPVRPWPVGAVALAVFAALSISWYARRGFVFDVTGPSPAAPPFGYTVLAFTGVALLSGALVSAAAGRYWVPFAAILLAAAVVSVLFEVPNAVHWHWAYAHFPGPVLPDGLPPAVFLSWPMQYVVFLAVPSLFVPRLAAVFWQPPG
ncbi:hypothetical protein ACFQZ4_06315 [Catellatospora coxensis]